MVNFCKLANVLFDVGSFAPMLKSISCRTDCRGWKGGKERQSALGENPGWLKGNACWLRWEVKKAVTLFTISWLLSIFPFFCEPNSWPSIVRYLEREKKRALFVFLPLTWWKREQHLHGLNTDASPPTHDSINHWTRPRLRHTRKCSQRLRIGPT